MTSSAENSKSVIEVDVYKGVLSSFHKTKNFLTNTAGKTDEVVDTATATAQQAQDSLTITTQKAVDTFTTATSDAIKTITTTTQQAKASIGESIEQTLQPVDQFRSKTANTMQTAIAASIHDWLQTHPTAAKLLLVLNWAINHPIISLVIALFIVAIAWSLIKAFSRLLEMAGLSILQVPFKLGTFLIRVSTKSASKFGSLAVKQLTVAKSPETPILPDSTSQLNPNTKQQRLAEISLRLEAIRQEQNQLLQEAAAILNSDAIDLKLEPLENNKSIYEQHIN